MSFAVNFRIIVLAHCFLHINIEEMDASTIARIYEGIGIYTDKYLYI